MKPAAGTIAAATLLSVIAAAVSLVQPLVVRDAFDRFERSESLGGLVPVIVVLFVLEAALGALLTYLLGRSGERIVFALRRTMVGRLLRWPVASHERFEVGDLISRVNADTGAIRGAIATSLSEFVSGIVVFVGAVVLMLFISPLLLLVTLACLAGAVVILLLVATGIMLATMQSQTALGRLSAGLESILRGVRTVKLNNAEPREAQRLGESLDQTLSAGVRLAKLEAMLSPATTVAVQVALIVVLWIGGARVATGELSLGDLIAFLLYLLYLVFPMASMFSSFTSFQAARAALARVDEVLDIETEAIDVELDAPLPTPRVVPPLERSPDRDGLGVEVVLRGVSFSYPRRRTVRVLDGLDLHVPRGSCVALVGQSGGGKSTILTLLARLYDVDSGEITIGGTDISQLPLPQLRGLIGFVEQDSPVMSGSIEDNLRYGAPNATDVDMRDALEKTNLSDFVRDLPDGLETQIGTGGVLVSGGLRQRIAIARALLRKTPLLLLDEITANMDGENEGHLNTTLERLRGDHTVIMAAHRLSTMRRADEIHVVARGEVLASGRHEDLLKESLEYRLLATSQIFD